MGTPVSIKSLFSAHSEDEEEEEPDWLSAPRPERELVTAPSTSSDDPFDLALLSPAKTALGDHAETSGAHAVRDTNGDAQVDKDAPPSLEAKPGSSHNAETPKSAPTTIPSSKASQPVTRVPLKNPASLKSQRLLVELPGEPEAAVDLTGDSGAVGRFIIASDKKAVLLDLKGVMYKGSLLAMPCTACIVNVGQSEAKIEAFCNEFLQLETDTAFASGELVMEGSVDHWALQDADYDFVNANGKDDAQGEGKGKPSKAKKPTGKQRGLGVSSGKVVKVSKKKTPGAGAKSKGSRKRK